MNTPIKRIAVIGPECTGKSVLSQKLAQHFRTTWVPEYARHYLEELGRPYTQEDLKAIALGQISMEDEHALHANRVLICDTNLYVIKIWSEFKYGSCDPWILEQIRKRHYDLYLLTDVDIPWEYDPQREHPHSREALYDIYKKELLAQSVPFLEISGSGEERTRFAVEGIEKLLTGAAGT